MDTIFLEEMNSVVQIRSAHWRDQHDVRQDHGQFLEDLMRRLCIDGSFQ